MNTGVVFLAADKSNILLEKTLKSNEVDLKVLLDETFGTQFHPLVIVLGHNREEVLPHLQGMPVGIIDDTTWQEGIGSSMRMGLVGSYFITKGIEAILFVNDANATTNTLQNLAELAKIHTDKDLFVPTSGGFPILVKSNLFEELLNLKNNNPVETLLEKGNVYYFDNL